MKYNTRMEVYLSLALHINNDLLNEGHISQYVHEQVQKKILKELKRYRDKFGSI